MRSHSVLGKRSLIALAVTTALPAMVQAEVNNDENTTPAFQFNQVVVTATKTENDLATAPASMSVITSEEIQSRPTMALNDIVEEAVGVESMQEGGRAGRESISIRGMDSSYTMVMVNGRKMSSSNAVIRGNDFDLSTIPQDNIERIEIIRGPMSALYGSEALGGVVNIITKLPDNEWRSSINGDYSRPTGSNNGGSEYMVGLNTGGALIDDELYLNLSLNKSARDAWKPYGGDRAAATPLEERDTLSFSGGLNWLINDNHTLDFDATYSKDEREGMIESSLNLTPTDQKVNRNSIAITHGGDWNWGESQLRYSRESVEFGEYDFNESHRNYVTETNNAVDGSASTDIGDHRLTFGGEIRKTELDNSRDLLDTGKADVLQQALFIQDEWGLADDWTLTYGTRMDHHEEFGFEFSPRAYLVNTVTDNLTIKGGVGKAFKAPSLLQLNEEYRLSSCKGACWIVGNPDLKPETSVSYELGVNYQEENWMVEATVYRNDVDNLIQADPDREADGGTYTYQNVDKVRINGVELGGRIALTKTLSLRGDFTFTDAKNRNTGELLTTRPRQSVSSKLDWDATDKVTTFVRATYTGKQRLNSTTNLNGYVMADMGANYKVNDDLRLRAGIRNIGNKKLSHDAEVLGYSLNPRTWYVGFTSSF